MAHCSGRPHIHITFVLHEFIYKKILKAFQFMTIAINTSFQRGGSVGGRGRGDPSEYTYIYETTPRTNPSKINESQHSVAIMDHIPMIMAHANNTRALTFENGNFQENTLTGHEEKNNINHNNNNNNNNSNVNNVNMKNNVTPNHSVNHHSNHLNKSRDRKDANDANIKEPKRPSVSSANHKRTCVNNRVMTSQDTEFDDDRGRVGISDEDDTMWIDSVSRVAFPIAFILFNLLYWINFYYYGKINSPLVN